MAGQLLNGHEPEHTPGVCGEQRSLACGHRVRHDSAIEQKQQIEWEMWVL